VIQQLCIGHPPGFILASSDLSLWLVLLIYGGAMWVIAPLTSAARGFFAGRDQSGRQPGVMLITMSIVVSWIFSKSITNTANLGRSYGLLGGVGYAVYYLGIPICGLLIIRLRRISGASSLAEYLSHTYGALASRLFMAIVLLRLFNEVWSNTSVVGGYFGPSEAAGGKPAAAFIGASLLFTFVVLLYTLKGGLRASLVTDVLQFGLLVIGVGVTLIWLAPRLHGLPLSPPVPGAWNSGLDFLLVALLQCVAYPFHDPILTDRAFLSDARTTRKAYFAAGAIAGAIIILFSLVGIAARSIDPSSQSDAPVAVAKAGGAVMVALMASVMILSGGSTIDSTFSSTSKAVAVDLSRPRRPVLVGRMAMIAMAILGNIPMLFGASLLKATTISGTMVLGLAPIFLFPSSSRRSALTFIIPVGISVAAGIVSGIWPDLLRWQIGSGQYASLLAWNVLTTVLAWGSFALLWRVGTGETHAIGQAALAKTTAAGGGD
jgi:Na+/proline symporter